MLGEAREFRDPDCTVSNFVTRFVIFLLKQKSIYLNACNEEDIGFVTVVECLLKMLKLFMFAWRPRVAGSQLLLIFR